jgi:hypothetical protein
VVKPEGVQTIHPIGAISITEYNLIKAALPELAGNIDNVSCLLLTLYQLMSTPWAGRFLHRDIETVRSLRVYEFRILNRSQ